MAAASGLSETMTLDDDSGAHEGNDEDNGDDAYGIESHGEQDAIARQVQLLLDLDRLGQIIARNRSNSADVDVLGFLCSARPWLFAAGRTGPAAPGNERARLHLQHDRARHCQRSSHVVWCGACFIASRDCGPVSAVDNRGQLCTTVHNVHSCERDSSDCTDHMNADRFQV